MALVDDMAGAGLLNRADESVPSREELLASPHRERGLPRPLLCVLLGYSKMSAFQLLLETDFPDGAAGRPVPRLLLPAPAARALRRALPGPRAAPRDRRDRRRQLPVNRGGIALLPRLEQGAKNGIGEAVTAWIEVDREAEAAGAARGACSPSGRPAAEEQAALLDDRGRARGRGAGAARGPEGRRREEGAREIRSRLEAVTRAGGAGLSGALSARVPALRRRCAALRDALVPPRRASRSETASGRSSAVLASFMAGLALGNSPPRASGRRAGARGRSASTPSLELGVASARRCCSCSRSRASPSALAPSLRGCARPPGSLAAARVAARRVRR